ncbi:MAG: lmo0937 family membrane protein [Deltaproteobacteria bacterium]|nr:lmo0937 family membrane protein [Deltaproteobacteria bacterium]
MLWTVAVVLLLLWALGIVSSYTMGGLVHLLLAAAAAVVLVRFIQRRRRLLS